MSEKNENSVMEPIESNEVTNNDPQTDDERLAAIDSELAKIDAELEGLVDAEVLIEEPKVTTAAQVIKTAPVQRQYVLIAAPSLTPKGRQRAIVLEILKSATKPMTSLEVAALAGPMGLQAAAGVSASVAWHLHQMSLLGITKVVNVVTEVAPVVVTEVTK